MPRWPLRLPQVKLHARSPWGPGLALAAASSRLGMGPKRTAAVGFTALICLRLLQTGTDGARPPAVSSPRAVRALHLRHLSASRVSVQAF